MGVNTSMNRLIPTKEEAFMLVEAATRIADHGETAPCPRCGELLIYEQMGNSFIIECSTDTCIRAGSRGL